MRKFTTKMSATEDKINGVEVVDVDEDSKSDEDVVSEKDKSTEEAEKSLENGDAEDAENGTKDDDDTEGAANGKEGGKKRGKKEKAAPKKKKGATKPKKKVKLAVEESAEEDEEEYEVQDIIDHRIEGKKKFYQIRWKGYGPSGDTWEAEGSLACPDIIKRYNAKAKTTTKTATGKKRGAPAKGKSPKGKAPAKKAKKAAVDSEDEDADEDAEYEVERIVDMHSKKNGKREFLVHWKGFSTKEDTWEPEDNLNCKELIEKFTEKLKGVKNATQKELRVAPKHTKRLNLSTNEKGRRLSRRNDSKERATMDNSQPSSSSALQRRNVAGSNAKTGLKMNVEDVFNGYAKVFPTLGDTDQLDCLKLLNGFFDEKLRAKYG